MHLEEIQKEIETIEDELLTASEYVKDLLEKRKSVLLTKLEMHKTTQEDFDAFFAEESLEQ